MNIKTSYGFTLIELMIVVVVVAILASVAIPSYNEYVARSKRADAQASLLSLSMAMEQLFLETNSYCDAGTTVVAGCGTGTGDSGAPTIHPSTVPKDGGTAYYNLTIASITPTSFQLKAVRTGGMSSDKCGDFILTNTGVQDIENQNSGITLSDCWK